MIRGYTDDYGGKEATTWEEIEQAIGRTLDFKIW